MLHSSLFRDKIVFLFPVTQYRYNRVRFIYLLRITYTAL